MTIICRRCVDNPENWRVEEIVPRPDGDMHNIKVYGGPEAEQHAKAYVKWLAGCKADAA